MHAHFVVSAAGEPDKDGNAAVTLTADDAANVKSKSPLVSCDPINMIVGPSYAKNIQVGRKIPAEFKIGDMS